MLTVGSLFAGIGGFDLGLERAGMRTVWFCEQDEFCQRVLAKHWPGVPCHPDVRALVAHPHGVHEPQEPQGDVIGAGRSARPDERGYAVERIKPAGAGAGRGDRVRTGPEGTTGPQRDAAGTTSTDGRPLPVLVPYVDVLCGGFPCQDISVAGRGAGIDGARSGLWSEYARLIRELRPRYVVVENVSALLARGLGRVLGDLAACGYDAEWDCIPASAVGAPHRRDRVWLVAYPSRDLQAGTTATRTVGQRARPSGQPLHVADSDCTGSQGHGESLGCAGEFAAPPGGADGGGRSNWWLVEPDVGRVAHGVPARVDRLRSLGNALVPQIAEWIGRRIVAYEQGELRDAA